MLDMLAYNTHTNQFEIFDFKTNKRFNTDSAFEKTLLSPLNHLKECEFNIYSLQLSLYKMFIQKYTDIKIDKLKIVWFSVSNKNYQIIELDYLPNECTTLLDKYLPDNAINKEITN